MCRSILFHGISLFSSSENLRNKIYYDVGIIYMIVFSLADDFFFLFTSNKITHIHKLSHSLSTYRLNESEIQDPGWISRKVLKHGIRLVLRYVLCSYLSF